MIFACLTFALFLKLTKKFRFVFLIFVIKLIKYFFLIQKAKRKEIKYEISLPAYVNCFVKNKIHYLLYFVGCEKDSFHGCISL